MTMIWQRAVRGRRKSRTCSDSSPPPKSASKSMLSSVGRSKAITKGVSIARRSQSAGAACPALPFVCMCVSAALDGRLRVEAVACALELVSIAPLWRQDQFQLLDKMGSAGLSAILIKVAAAGLRSVTQVQRDIRNVPNGMCACMCSSCRR